MGLPFFQAFNVILDYKDNYIAFGLKLDSPMKGALIEGKPLAKVRNTLGDANILLSQDDMFNSEI